MNFHGRGRVKIDSVGFAGNFDVFSPFRFAGEVFRLVQVIHPFQSTDRNGVDIADGEIRVQAVFEREVLLRREVGHGQFRREGLADGDGIGGGKFLKEGGGGRIRQGKAQVDFAGGRLGHFAQFPSLGSGKAMGRFAFARAEPRKDDGDAAANRRAGVEMAELAHEQNRRLILFLEMGDMRPVQINLRAAPGRLDFQKGQIPVAFGEKDAPRNFQRFLRLRCCHKNAAVTEINRAFEI